MNMTRDEYVALPEDQRKIIDNLRKAMASTIAKDAGMTEEEALQSVIELLEHGHLKMLMRDGNVGLVPCTPDGRLLAEV
jgi:hypothetical protein